MRTVGIRARVRRDGDGGTLAFVVVVVVVVWWKGLTGLRRAITIVRAGGSRSDRRRNGGVGTLL